MSYGQNGQNGYANGYRNQPPTRYEEDYRDGGPVDEPTAGARRARRAGGYGGFGGDPMEVVLPTSNQPPRVDQLQPYNARPVPTWRRAHSEEDGNGLYPGSTSRTYGEGPGARQIEGVMYHINEKWSVLKNEDCVPVHVALQLMDHSSLGRGSDYDDFKNTSKQLQKALRTIVNEHHQGFNSSIGTFHKIQASIQTSQQRVRTLKLSLIESKANLTVAKPELKGLAAASQNYDEMLQVLGQIEKIQALPEQLDARISDKHFLTAVDVLQDALRFIRNSSLENIGALADMKVYLNNQETSLADILLEELHDHVYLKSAYCQNRWKAFAPLDDDSLDPEKSVNNMSTGIRPLYRFLAGLNSSVPVVDDTSRNPEEDSFGYMQMIIEALNKMGRLDVAVDRMEQRLPIELFAVVEKTNQEVDNRHLPHLRSAQRAFNINPNMSSDKTGGLDAVLNDLLYTLYSKFEAIAEGHRAIHEVIMGIIEREGVRKTDHLTGGFKELWKLFQSEMRSLLHDYLATDGNDGLYTLRDSSMANTNIFHRNARDKLKKVFKLGEVDKKSSQLAAEQEELDKILQASVPGLVNKSMDQPRSRKGDMIMYDSPAAGHKLLVEPSVFNISVLLPPSVSFLQRLKDIVPPDSDIAVSTLTSFLDDFLVNVYNPQLEETVTDMCAQSFMDADAFQQDPHWADKSRMPIFQGTSLFMSMIRAFCKMLDSIPQDQNFAQLIVSQLRTYHARCMTWYRSMVVRSQAEGDVRPKLAAAMLEGSDLAVVVRTIWRGDRSDQEALMMNEVEMIVARTKETPIDPFDIISDRRSGTALCLLYSSMQWLASQLEELRVTTNKTTSGRETNHDRQTNRWTMVSSVNMCDQDQPVTLPMTEETLAPFNYMLVGFRDLAATALFTLHIDIRFAITYLMSQALEAPYLLDQLAAEPDRSILMLNTDLLAFDDTMTTHLPEKEYKFMTSGLGLLVDSLIVIDASKIKAMNLNGCERMQLNILVLQQNLKSVEKDVVLAKSTQFFEYFHQGPKAVVEKAKETAGKNMGLDLEEMKILVELCYSEGLQSDQRDVAAQAKRAMGDDMLQLTEYMWST